MKDLNGTHYEVVSVETLHGLKEHINNILKELPKNLTNEERPIFEQVIETVLSTKEKLRGADFYHLFCIVLAVHLGRHCCPIIRMLLHSLSEMHLEIFETSFKTFPIFTPIIPDPLLQTTFTQKALGSLFN